MTVADLSAWELRRSAEPVGKLFDGLLAGEHYSDPAMQIGTAGEITLSATAQSCGAEAQNAVCELRQQAANRDISSWTAAEEGYLSASLAINSVPVDADGAPAPVAVLRIHGTAGELAALRYEAGQLRLELSRSDSGRRSVELLTADGSHPLVALGDRFDCFVRVTMTTITTSVMHRGRTYHGAAEIGRDWLTSPLHFSTGVCFGRDGSTGQAEVTVFSLSSPALPRGSRPARSARPSVASAELVVRLSDGERLSFPVAVEQRRRLRR